MLKLKKPRRLRPGSRVATVSPSWGGPGSVPSRYEMGVRELPERFGLTVVEMPHTRAPADYVWRHPEARAADLHAAFADPTMDGVIATIGGDDSIRVLPYLDPAVFRDHPKVFMGFSDTTTLHLFALQAGLQTFYGPAVMAGIAENGGMLPYTEALFRRVLMSGEPIGPLAPAAEWTEEPVRWEDTARAGQRRTMQPNPGWRWLGGRDRVAGPLAGGCIEVVDFLRGTPWWPGPAVWDGAVFFFETSEDVPPPAQVKYWLRVYGMLGIVERLAGILVGRPRGYTPEQHQELEHALLQIVADEFGRPDLPIVTGLDFGHTDPQMILPLGARVELDPGAGTIVLPEAGTEV